MYNLRARKRSKTKKVVKKAVKKEFKVYVFDLDDTLYLRTNDDLDYKREYHIKVKNYLTELKKRNKILCLATHNSNPKLYLSRIGIENLFDHIVYELKDLHSCYNTISEYTSKKEMITEIMRKTGYKKNKIIFFDDSDYNIDQVNSIGVRSIKVSKMTGLDMTFCY